MEFRIADTFTDSFAKLSGDEQKAVKTAAFDLQLNPAHPALQFHKVDKAKGPQFWSVHVNLDIRLILQTSKTFLPNLSTTYRFSPPSSQDRRSMLKVG
jgi:hypothetical protein